MAVAPDEWENLAIEADNASLEGKEADPDAIPNDAQAYAQQLKDQRNEIRKKELEDALATFALDPKAERRKNKKPFVCCCPGVRRFFGLCYFKNLHEAVIDGDTSTIISKLQNAQAKDARAIKRLGGVERTVHGKKHDGEENKDHFQGKAAALKDRRQVANLQRREGAPLSPCGAMGRRGDDFGRDYRSRSRERRRRDYSRSRSRDRRDRDRDRDYDRDRDRRDRDYDDRDRDYDRDDDRHQGRRRGRDRGA
jgi:hypothetical protein